MGAPMDEETLQQLQQGMRRWMIHALPEHRAKFTHNVPTEDHVEQTRKHRRGDLRRAMHNSRCYPPGKKGDPDIPPEELPFSPLPYMRPSPCGKPTGRVAFEANAA